MRVVNPATGEVLREVAEADRAAVAGAFRRARAAQPAWVATPLAARRAAIRRFRALAVERAEPLARTLTLEVGKPIMQARGELAGLLPRIDFFLAEVEGALADGGDVGAMLLEEPIDAVCFTGSHATGVKVAAAVAPRLVKAQLELGGKDPVYVCDDVDAAAAAAAVADGAFYNSGQSCCAVERVYVHERVWARFVDAFVETV